MKKFSLFLTLLCLCLLTACGGEKRVSGRVTSYDFAPDGTLASFVVQADSGKEVIILLDGDTWVVLWPDGVTEEEFLSGALDGVKVTVDHDGKRQTLADGNGGSLRAWTADTIFVNEVLTEDALTLSDGTPMRIWTGSSTVSYCLADGTELLWERHSIGPENVYVGGAESYDDLSETAKAAVSAFYEEQGLLYDVEDELERAYASYRPDEENAQYHGYSVSQEVSPTASNEHLMFFLTTVTLPVDRQQCTELRLGAVFDRHTGEHLNVWDLFSCDEETVKRTILDIAGVTDPVLRAEMEAAFDPEQLVFFPDNLEVSFPAGTLPSQEHTYLLGLDYDQRLCAILYDWAVPTPSEP